jgi:hypothetical protein
MQGRLDFYDGRIEGLIDLRKPLAVLATRMPWFTWELPRQHWTTLLSYGVCLFSASIQKWHSEGLIAWTSTRTLMKRFRCSLYHHCQVMRRRLFST